jgi:hypothetical protein
MREKRTAIGGRRKARLGTSFHKYYAVFRPRGKSGYEASL